MEPFDVREDGQERRHPVGGVGDCEAEVAKEAWTVEAEDLQPDFPGAARQQTENVEEAGLGRNRRAAALDELALARREGPAVQARKERAGGPAGLDAIPQSRTGDRRKLGPGVGLEIELQPQRRDRRAVSGVRRPAEEKLAEVRSRDSIRQSAGLIGMGETDRQIDRPIVRQAQLQNDRSISREPACQHAQALERRVLHKSRRQVRPDDLQPAVTRGRRRPVQRGAPIRW